MWGATVEVGFPHAGQMAGGGKDCMKSGSPYSYLATLKQIHWGIKTPQTKRNNICSFKKRISTKLSVVVADCLFLYNEATGRPKQPWKSSFSNSSVN